MVNREKCSRNTIEGPWRRIRSRGSVLMDTAPAGGGPGAWLRNSGQLPGASKHKMLLENLTHRTPGSQNLSALVKVLVKGLCWVSAQEVPWMGLGRRSGPPTKECCSTSSHTAPQGPRIYITRYKVWLGAYVKFQPVGWPGWACGGLCEAWWEVDNARGSHPNEGDFTKKESSKVQHMLW